MTSGDIKEGLDHSIYLVHRLKLVSQYSQVKLQTSVYLYVSYQIFSEEVILIFT